MEYHQITLNEWADMKEQLRRELNNVRQSFVRVGYVLRRMEDTKAYEAEGYRSVAEFAEKEHGLKPSTTSRWMSINREFSLDGYSNTLDPKYIDMNASQLQEMLTMSAEDRELVTPDMRREDIRELKRLGNMPEERGGFEEIVEKFFGEYPDLLREVQKMMEEPCGNAAMIELVNPSGTRSYRKDGAMIFLYEDKVKYKAAGHSPEVREYDEFFEVAEGIEVEEEPEVEKASVQAAEECPDDQVVEETEESDGLQEESPDDGGRAAGTAEGDKETGGAAGRSNSEGRGVERADDGEGEDGAGCGGPDAGSQEESLGEVEDGASGDEPEGEEEAAEEDDEAAAGDVLEGMNGPVAPAQIPEEERPRIVDISKIPPVEKPKISREAYAETMKKARDVCWTAMESMMNKFNRRDTEGAIKQCEYALKYLKALREIERKEG